MDYLYIVFTSIASVLVLFVLAKLMGNKQISQLTTFDYIIGITIGSIAAEMATDLEGDAFPEVIAMAVYAALSFLISLATQKSFKARKIFTGKPIVLMENNKIYRDRLGKARLDINDFLAICRLAGYFDIDQIEVAVFEHNGNISFLPKSESRPLTPDDIKQAVEIESPFVELIIDGKMIPENLQNVGKDENWLKKAMYKEGYKSPSEIFLLSADDSNNVRIYPMVNCKKKE